MAIFDPGVVPGTGGGGGGTVTNIAIAMGTGAMGSSGLAAYQDAVAPSTADPTDNAALATARFVGFYEGTAGKIEIVGTVGDAQFTTVGGSPSNGAPVYLAAAGDDGGGSAGKLTATPPVASGSVVAKVGICLDNASYAGSKTSKILIQPEPPMVNP